MLTLLDELTAHQKNRNDKRTFGLVIQGGGMRAAYSAAAAAVLINHDVFQAFDHITGSSAGAINAAYLLAADTEALNHTYSDDLSNKNFVNLLRKDKKVDIDYLVDTVINHKRPLTLEKLEKSPTKLHIVVTDAKSGRKVVLSDHESLLKLYEEFRATAALPILYGRQIKIDDRYYVDGGVADLIPVDVAVKLGCTDVVVIMTQQIKSYHFDKHHSRLVKHLIRKLAKDQTKALRNVLPTNEHLLKANLRILSKPHRKIRMYILEPSDENTLISLGVTDKEKVAALVKLGATDMEAFLSKSSSS